MEERKIAVSSMSFLVIHRFFTDFIDKYSLPYLVDFFYKYDYLNLKVFPYFTPIYYKTQKDH